MQLDEQMLQHFETYRQQNGLQNIPTQYATRSELATNIARLNDIAGNRKLADIMTFMACADQSVVNSGAFDHILYELEGELEAIRQAQAAILMEMSDTPTPEQCATAITHAIGCMSYLSAWQFTTSPATANETAN